MKMTEKIKILFVFVIAIMFAGNANAQETAKYDQGFRLGFGANAGYSIDYPYKYHISVVLH